MQSSPIERAYRLDGAIYNCRVAFEPDAVWQECEKHWLGSGHPLPLTHRTAWAGRTGPPETWFISVSRDGDGWECALAAGLHPSRALPGHKIVRLQRFGASGASGRARQAGLQFLADLAEEDSRVLSAHVEVFSRDDGTRSSIGEVLGGLGFQRLRRGRSYRHTVIIDLRPPESEIFMSLHSTGRRHVRAVQKRPAEIRVISDPVYGARLEELMRETLERTGGVYQPRDWSALIELAAEHPDLARVVGLFQAEREGPESLLAFVIGYSHGDHVEYSYAASTRKVNLRMPYGYAPAWDLICWAKRVGAEWFDFGGVTDGTHEDDDDPLGGISDFKRYFSKEVVEVGEEWVLEPSPVKAAAARAVRAGAAWTRSVVDRSLQAVGARGGE